MRRRIEVPSECKVVSLDRDKIHAIILDENLPVEVLTAWYQKFEAEGLNVVFCAPGTSFFQLREGQTYLLKLPKDIKPSTVGYFIDGLRNQGLRAVAVNGDIEINIKEQSRG